MVLNSLEAICLLIQTMLPLHKTFSESPFLENGFQKSSTSPLRKLSSLFHIHKEPLPLIPFSPFLLLSLMVSAASSSLCLPWSWWCVTLRAYKSPASNWVVDLGAAAARGLPAVKGRSLSWYTDAIIQWGMGNLISWWVDDFLN